MSHRPIDFPDPDPHSTDASEIIVWVPRAPDARALSLLQKRLVTFKSYRGDISLTSFLKS